MLDKTIPYKHVIMRRKAGSPLPEDRLPEGYSFRYFRDGDLHNWARIETSVLEFETQDEARAYFLGEYLPYMKELRLRCMFIEDKAGEAVATLTSWWGYTGVRRDPFLHWVAVSPDFQGKGLGKALVAEGLRRTVAIEGDRNVYLHTQTWSYKAIGIYERAGFEIISEKGIGGYENADYEEAREILSRVMR